MSSVQPTRSLTWLLALAAATSACATSASLPPTASTVAPGQRASTYERYKLGYDFSVLTGSRWKRADGEYMLGQIDKVLAAYPETTPGVDKFRARATTIGLIGGVGGAIVGYTLGFNLTAPQHKRWSSGAQATGYGVGGGLILTSFLIQALWSDPGPAMTDTYNKALHRDLVER